MLSFICYFVCREGSTVTSASWLLRCPILFDPFVTVQIGSCTFIATCTPVRSRAPLWFGPFAECACSRFMRARQHPLRHPRLYTRYWGFPWPTEMCFEFLFCFCNAVAVKFAPTSPFVCTVFVEHRSPFPSLSLFLLSRSFCSLWQACRGGGLDYCGMGIAFVRHSKQ